MTELSEPWLVAAWLAAGAATAALHLYMLRLAVGRLLRAPRPAAHVVGSLLGRLAVSGAAFYLLAHHGGAPALIAGLAGFVVVRTIVVSRPRLQANGP